MSIQWFACKHCPPVDGRPLLFHPDDKEDFIEHLAAHGVDTSVLDDTPWWDVEGGYSISPTDRVQATTPVARTQFGDGSEEQIRDNARKWTRLRDLEAISGHKTPAAAFIGAKVLEPKDLAEGKAASVKPPKLGQPPEVGLTPSSPPAVVESEVAHVGRQARVSSKSRKGTNDMTTKTANKKNPYANAPVVNLTVGAGVKSAPRVCVTTGIGFSDVNAIKTILELVQKQHPTAVVTNQGRYDGDKLVANVARSIGLGYEMTLPKFLEARNRNQPLFDRTHVMNAEEQKTVGYVELQERIAETCIELHVFGTPSGPQRGLIEAFNECDKSVNNWGTSTD